MLWRVWGDLEGWEVWLGLHLPAEPTWGCEGLGQDREPEKEAQPCPFRFWWHRPLASLLPSPPALPQQLRPPLITRPAALPFLLLSVTAQNSPIVMVWVISHSPREGWVGSGKRRRRMVTARRSEVPAPTSLAAEQLPSSARLRPVGSDVGIIAMDYAGLGAGRVTGLPPFQPQARPKEEVLEQSLFIYLFILLKSS